MELIEKVLKSPDRHVPLEDLEFLRVLERLQRLCNPSSSAYFAYGDAEWWGSDAPVTKEQRSGKRFCWRYGKAVRLGGHYGGYTGDPYYDSNNYYHEHYRTSRDRFRDRVRLHEGLEELAARSCDSDDYDYWDY